MLALFLLVLLLPSSLACPKKPTLKPIQGCSICETNSFYPLDKCDGPAPLCEVFKPELVTNETILDTHCKKADMFCPPDSYVSVIMGDKQQAVVLWSDFKSITNFSDIRCNDTGKWIIALTDKATTLESIYCFIPAQKPNCSHICTDLPAPSAEQCLGESGQSCQGAKLVDAPPTVEFPCQYKLQCPSTPITMDTLTIYITLQGYGTVPLTPEQLTTSTVTCNGNNTWYLRGLQGMGDGYISSVACIYTYTG